MAPRRTQRPRRTPSPRRPARSSPRSRTSTRTSATAGPARTTGQGRDFDRPGRLTAPLLAELDPPRDAGGLSVRPGAVHGRDQRRPGGARPRRRATSTPSRSARRRRDARHRRDPRTHAAPAGRAPRNRPTIEFARSNLAVPWTATARACSSSPKRATSRCAGRAAPASARPARPPSSPAIVDTTPTRSRPPPTEAHSSAARSRGTTWCSTCDRQQAWWLAPQRWVRGSHGACLGARQEQRREIMTEAGRAHGGDGAATSHRTKGTTGAMPWCRPRRGINSNNGGHHQQHRRGPGLAHLSFQTMSSVPAAFTPKYSAAGWPSPAPEG